MCDQIDISSLGFEGPIPAHVREKIHKLYYSCLINNMTCGSLIFELLAQEVISLRHYEVLDTLLINFKKNEELLNIILRRSFRQYKSFVGCLRSTHQSHLANLLDAEGGNYTIILQFLKDFANNSFMSFSHDY